MVQEQTTVSGRLSVVNGLRGLAIIGVLFQHVAPFDFRGGGRLAWILPLVSNGWTGVNMFFILSGFVLFLPYAGERRRMTAWADVTTFYRHRFFRLMPLYYFMALVVLAMAGRHVTPPAWEHAAEQLLFLGFVFNRHAFMPPLNFPLWSIGVEILFSIIFPMLVILVARLGMRRMLTLAVVGALLTRVAGRLWNPEPLGPNFISDNIFGRIDEFVLGMAIATLHARNSVPSWAPRLLWPGIGAILLAWEGFYQCQYHGLSMVIMSPLNNLVDAGFCCVLLAALERERVGRSALGFAPLQVIGMMCYSIYIWHAPVLTRLGPVVGAIPALLAVLLLAAFTYRYIEFGRERDWRVLFLWPEVLSRRHAAVAPATSLGRPPAP